MSELITAVTPDPARVVIAGGGVGALEALLALRATAGPYVDVDLISPRREFTYQALAVAEPFGLSERRPVDVAEIAREQGARFHEDALESLDPGRRTVKLRSGETLPYDALLLAVGTRGEEILPGALTFRGPPDTDAYRLLLGEIESGVVTSLAFAAAPGARWALPLYELALMTAGYAARRRVEGLKLTFVTHEDRPLELFGPRVSDRLEKLLADAGVELLKRTTPLAVQPGRLLTAPGGTVAADRVVTLPKLRVPRIPGVPQGPGGFIPTDEFGLVEGLEDVYAVGDATWYPVKQGGLAAQQADSAASAIAAKAGAPVTRFAFSPVLRGVLLTGAAPQYLRAPRAPAAARPSTAPLWWPVSKVAGRYLGPYLAGQGVSAQPRELTDLPEREDPEHGAALGLALQAADAAAGWGDNASALRWLEVAEGLNVALPPEYALKREQWREAAVAG